MLDQLTLTHAACRNVSHDGFGMTLRVGATVYSPNDPGSFSEMSERLGSKVSSPPPASGSPKQPVTMTSLPRSSHPVMSQPRILGKESRSTPTPRSDQRSCMFTVVAASRMRVCPGPASGAGHPSLRSRAESGLSLSTRTATAARMRVASRIPTEPDGLHIKEVDIRRAGRVSRQAAPASLRVARRRRRRTSCCGRWPRSGSRPRPCT